MTRPDNNLTPKDSGQNRPEPHEQQTLLFEGSPFGTIDAIVQHDGHSVYFYLNGPEPFGTRACWVRNLEPGPYVLDQEAMREGQTPMLPRTHCVDPTAQPLPREEALHVIWLEEGNGAVLLEESEPIAFIPPWSGADGFHGYAKECAAESPICWPMPARDQMHQRFARAAEFWLSFQDEKQNPFQTLQSRLLEILDTRFGDSQPGNYFSIDGGRFPPRGLSVYARPGRIVATTIGMSLCPQPGVELQCESPGPLRRIELGLKFETERSADDLQNIWQALSGLAAYPWQRQTWLGPGHTVPLDAFSSLLGESCQYALLLPDGEPGEAAARPLLPSFRGDPVTLLWLVPLTDSERNDLEQGKRAAIDFECRTLIKI